MDDGRDNQAPRRTEWFGLVALVTMLLAIAVAIYVLVSGL